MSAGPLGGLAYVVLNFNNSEATHRCVRSIYANSRSSPRVLVVDNGSRSEELLSLKSGNLEFKLLSLQSNVGFAAGMNAGMRMALEDGARYLVLMNNDTVVVGDAIEEMLNCALRVPLCGITVPNQSFQGTRIGGRSIDHPPEIHPAEDWRVRRMAAGFCWLIDRDVIRRVGMFDESFFFGREDDDYCNRVRNSGLVIVEALRAMVYHDLEGTNKVLTGPTMQRFRLYHMSRGRGLMLRKYQSGVIQRFASVPDVFRLGRDILAVVAKNEFNLDYFDAAVTGYLDGLSGAAVRLVRSP